MSYERWNMCETLCLMFFRLCPVETLHALVSSGVGGAGCSVPVCLTGGSVGPVCLPRRAETFGGFDSHQMNSSKSKTHTLTHKDTQHTQSQYFVAPQSCWFLAGVPGFSFLWTMIWCQQGSRFITHVNWWPAAVVPSSPCLCPSICLYCWRITWRGFHHIWNKCPLGLPRWTD